jgi:hypothetical protein
MTCEFNQFVIYFLSFTIAKCILSSKDSEQKQSLCLVGFHFSFQAGVTFNKILQAYLLYKIVTESLYVLTVCILCQKVFL